MRRTLLTAFLLFIALPFSYGQSCCLKKSSCDGLVAFASDKDFHAAHISPEPFEYQAEKGKMISFKTSDGKTGSAFQVLSSQKTNKVLLVFHEWWGLNDYIKREAEKIQKDLGNVNVYAIDPFDGKIATSPDSAGKYMQGMSPERGQNIISGLLNTLDKDAQIGSIGWCMGGSWSFQSALLAGKKSKAVVMYYGFPETNDDKFKKLETDVLYIQGLQDSFISKEAVAEFEKDVKSAGRKIEIKQYDAVHAFANPSNPKYNKEASTDAYSHALNYLRKSLSVK